MGVVVEDEVRTALQEQVPIVAEFDKISVQVFQIACVVSPDSRVINGCFQNLTGVMDRVAQLAIFFDLAAQNDRLYYIEELAA